MSFYRFTVKNKKNGFIEMPEDNSLTKQAEVFGFSSVEKITASQIYFIKGNLSTEDIEVLSNFLFCDELYEYCEAGEAFFSPEKNKHLIETALKPGVTDSSAREALRAVKELGITGIEEIASGTSFEITGNLSGEELHRLAKKVLCNGVIQMYKIGFITPVWTSENKPNDKVEYFDIANMSDEQLSCLSSERRAALNLKEMQAVRGYFKKENRLCSDAEFETIAQTWSEHCVHKTFKAKISIDTDKTCAEKLKPYPGAVVNGVLKTYIKKATDEINAPWVLSSFVDNAGIIEFGKEHEVSFKVETHNHPSAIEPFGGANTGVGGVIRDVMGVSARPFAVTDVLCFGMPDTPAEEVPEGSLHPKQIIDGVVAGIKDYGNKMGIPTVNGGVHYHKLYSSNPLVYCGCAGISPRGLHKTKPSAGDHIFSLGGKTGRDGLRGATFSSMVMDASTGDVAGSSVQIGEPIIQKKVAEILITARNEGLYSAITDCGAGGYSSAVGEMAEKLGCDVDLSRIPVKYAGLTPWELWLSESQERMVIAVPEKNIERLKEICEDNDVEYTDLGVFTGDKILKVRFAEKTVINLSCEFLHSGPPVLELKAYPPQKCECKAECKKEGGLKFENLSYEEILKEVMSHHAVSSKEDIVRFYDHEVQGGTVLKPYAGCCGKTPQDAAVVKPMESTGKTAAALSNALNPRQSLVCPYKAAASAIDEAVRGAVASGADPERIAVLDNFCMGDPKRPETMWALIEMCRACYETASVFKTPFISGKDSFNNEYLSSSGERISIPPSLLISAIGIVPDIDKVPGTEFKKEGSLVYFAGKPGFAFGGSVFADIFGIPRGENTDVPAFDKASAELYKKLHKAILAGTVLACHDISDGGLASALYEMSFSEGLSTELETGFEAAFADFSKTAILFGETNGCFAVEVPASKKAEFESIMQGSEIRKIGKVKKGCTLSF